MDLQNLLASPIDGWRLLLAVLVGIATVIVARFARRGALALAGRTPGVRPALAEVVARVVGYGVVVLGFGLALALLGANVQPLLAVVLIAAVIAVLVLRGVADNVAAGVLLQARQTVRVGDEIAVEALDAVVAGTVTELTSRSVILHTPDGRTVHIPNSRLLSEPLVNDSIRGARRSEVQVRVHRDPDVDIDDVLAALIAAASAAEGVHRREPVRGFVLSVGPDRLTVRLQFWHHPIHGLRAVSAVVVAVSDALVLSDWRGTVSSTPGVPPAVPPDPV
ncbi:mechanosensitive ion channel family protein [Microbacterium paraoxydans]|uniref:mechanosensitive ion channel family protein n=1 Tax=Microbacterium paraoxydans TaxID=199592 RepID=UPI003D72362B